MRTLCIIICLALLPLSPLEAAVRIAIDDNPPLGFIDNSGQAKGFFPELINQIAAENNWEIEYVACTWTRCLEQLATGEVDMLPAIGYSKGRAQFYHYSRETILNKLGADLSSQRYQYRFDPRAG